MQRDELTDEQVAELLELGILAPVPDLEDDRRPGTKSHAMSVLFGAAATAAVVHGMASLPKGVKP